MPGIRGRPVSGIRHVPCPLQSHVSLLWPQLPGGSPTVNKESGRLLGGRALAVAAVLSQALNPPAVGTSRGLGGGGYDRDLGFKGITPGQCEDGGKGETAGRETREATTAVVRGRKHRVGNVLAKESRICKTRK